MFSYIDTSLVSLISVVILISCESERVLVSSVDANLFAVARDDQVSKPRCLVSAEQEEYEVLSVNVASSNPRQAFSLLYYVLIEFIYFLHRLLLHVY